MKNSDYVRIIGENPEDVREALDRLPSLASFIRGIDIEDLEAAINGDTVVISPLDGMARCHDIQIAVPEGAREVIERDGFTGFDYFGIRYIIERKILEI